jgi:hypothetical protein
VTSAIVVEGLGGSRRLWPSHDVARRLHRVDNRRMGYLRSLFGQFCADEDDADADSMLAFSLFIGSPFIAAQPGNKTRSQMLQLAVDRLLSESWA